MLQVRSASGYDATCVFEFVEEPFDAIAQRIEQRIDWALNVAIALGYRSRGRSKTRLYFARPARSGCHGPKNTLSASLIRLQINAASVQEAVLNHITVSPRISLST